MRGHHMTIPYEVWMAAKENDRQRKMQELEETMKKEVSGEEAVARFVEGLDHDMAHEISRRSKEIKIWTVLDRRGDPSGYYVIFNIAEIEGRKNFSSIQIKVPAGKGGLVAGPGRCNLRDMKYFPFLKKRNIVWFDLCVEEA